MKLSDIFKTIFSIWFVIVIIRFSVFMISTATFVLGLIFTILFSITFPIFALIGIIYLLRLLRKKRHKYAIRE